MRKFYLLFILAFLFQSVSAQQDSVPHNNSPAKKTEISYKKGDGEKPDKIDKIQPNNLKPVNDCCCDAVEMTCLNGNTKTDLKIINIDFRARNTAFPDQQILKNLKRGDAIQIRLYNYNPWLYQVIVNHADSTIKAPQSAQVLNYILDPTNLSTIAGMIAAQPNAAANTAPASNIVSTSLLNKGFSYMALVRHFEKTENGKKIIVTNVQANVMKDSVQNLQDSRQEITYAQKDINDLREELLDLKKYLERIFFLETNMTSFLSERDPDCMLFSKANIVNRISDIDNDFEEARKNIGETRSNVDLDKADYFNKFAPYIDFSKKNSEIHFSDSLIKDFFLKSEILLTKADSLASYKQQQAMTSAIRPLQLLSTCYESLPLFFTDDLKSITLQVSPWKDSTLRLPSYQTQFQLPWQQKHVWGVSAGVYLGTMHDDNYGLIRTIDSVSNDTTYNYKKDNTGGLEFGVSANAYYGWLLNKDNAYPIYGGFNFGAAFSVTSNPKPRIQAGGSLIIGNKNRIVFSLGVMTGYSQRLSSVYDGLKNFPLPSNTTITKSQLTAGGFLSLSYSFL